LEQWFNSDCDRISRLDSKCLFARQHNCRCFLVCTIFTTHQLIDRRGSGFIIATVVAYTANYDAFVLRKDLVLMMVAFWGIRLSAHIGYRHWGHSEDFRYQSLRKRIGKNYWWISFFVVFVLQGKES
jgi:steroid 5-alpha reductase family enzyme